MSQTKAKKTFDCLAYKDRVQEEIYEKIKDMTVQEQIDYYNRAAETGPLGDWWRSIRKPPARDAKDPTHTD